MVGGTHHLGCWQRHPPRYTKTCKSVDFPWFWICQPSTSNEQKQTKRLIHATLFNTVYLTYVFYKNLTHVVVVVPLIHVTNTRSEGSCNTNNSRSFFFTKHKIRDSAISTLYESMLSLFTLLFRTHSYTTYTYTTGYQVLC